MAIKNDENRIAAEKLWQRYQEAGRAPDSVPRSAFVEVIGEALDDLEGAFNQLHWEAATRTMALPSIPKGVVPPEGVVKSLRFWAREIDDGLIVDMARLATRLERWLCRQKVCGAVDPDGDFTCTRAPHPPHEHHSAPITQPFPWGKEWGEINGTLTWKEVQDE